MAITLLLISHWLGLMALMALTGSLVFARLFVRGSAPVPARAARVRMALLALVGLAFVAQAIASQNFIPLIARLAILGALFWRQKSPAHPELVEGRAGDLVLAFALLLTQSLTSRSAVQGLPLLADFAHLALAAVWLGGVGQFALVYAPQAWRNRADPGAIAQLGLLVARFSPVAMFCVLGLGMTGIAQSAAYLPSVESLWTSAYGRALAVKLILFGVLIAFGAFHQQVVAPKLRANLRVLRAGSAIAQQNAQNATRQFARAIVLEMFASLALLLAVAAMLVLPLPGQ